MTFIQFLRASAFILLAGLNSPAFSSDTAPTTSPLDTAKSCFRAPFTSYDSWLSVIEKSSTKRFKDEAKVKESMANFQKRFTREAYEKYRQSISCDTFIYPSGDTKVEGFVIKPKNIEGNLPVIIYNRGGNGKYGRVIFARMLGSLFPMAEQGFIVVGSQYRRAGRNGEPKFDDEFGGADVLDVVNLAKLIPGIEGADANRVGMFGSSRGGMQSYMAIRAGVDAKALVTIAGATDLFAGLEFRPEMENVYKKRIPNYETQKTSALTDRSALLWIEELDGLYLQPS